MNYLLVFLGGGLGSLCRFGITQLLQRYQFDFPLATLFSNALSCLVFGMAAEALLKNYLDSPYRLLILTGFCGGFSTFSTFTNETWLLFYNGQVFLALANVFLSLFICLICLYLGMKLV